jgi:release factor glutamine methyltransferase
MGVLGVERATLFARSTPLTPDEARSFGLALYQRCTGVPLQHLTGEQQFRHLTLRVRPGVFIPRPETEEVVGVALDLIERLDHPPTVVDVCSGSGAIGLAIKNERPDATVVAVDISNEAVDLVAENAGLLGLDVQIVKGDLLEAVPASFVGCVDMIVSNPPYVSGEEYEVLPVEVRADPRLALVGGTQIHARLVEQARGLLRTGGWLVMEIGESQGEEVLAMMRLRFDDARSTKDLAGRDRIVSGRLA